jgi:hypothetical protein
MTADAFFRTLCDRLDRKPFAPFIAELADGGRVAIDDPHAAAVRGGAAYVLGHRTNTELHCGDVVRFVDEG